MLKNKEEKTVIKNGMYVYILNIFATVVPLFTIPYVTRVLGANGYGMFSDAFTVINYCVVIVEYGFGMYGARRIAVSSSQNEVDECFSSIFLSRCLLCIVSVALLTIYISAFKLNKDTIFCVLILFLMVIGSLFQQNWLMQGMQKMQYITIISVISRIVSIIGIFVFVKTSQHVFLYCFFYALTNLLIGLLGFILAFRIFRVKLIRLPIVELFIVIRQASYTFISSMSGRVMVSFGITVLSLTETQNDVGIYSAINKLPNVIVLMFSPISQAIYPFLSRKFSISFQSGFRFVCKIAFPVMSCFFIGTVVISIISERLVYYIFGDEYVNGYRLLIIFMAWINFSIANNFLGIQTLVASDHSKYYGEMFVLTALISVILNLILVKIYGMYGAAFALLLSEALLSLLLSIVVYKLYRGKIQ